MEEKKMNERNTMKGLSALLGLFSFAMVASAVSAAEGDVTATSYNWDAAKLGAGIAILITLISLG